MISLHEQEGSIQDLAKDINQTVGDELAQWEQLGVMRGMRGSEKREDGMMLRGLAVFKVWCRHLRVLVAKWGVLKILHAAPGRCELETFLRGASLIHVAIASDLILEKVGKC